MTCSLERTRKPLINSSNNDRISSLVLSTKSNEHSPRRQSSSLTPTNTEQSKIDLLYKKQNIFFFVVVFSYRSYPYLSISRNGADSTIVPTTPVDPSVTNLGLLSPSSLSTTSITDNQQFKKSTSMRFAKLMEHPSKFLFANYPDYVVRS
jgi:hypothetical protein